MYKSPTERSGAGHTWNTTIGVFPCVPTPVVNSGTIEKVGFLIDDERVSTDHLFMMRLRVRLTIDTAEPAGGHANRASAALIREPNDSKAQIQWIKAVLASQNPKSTERFGHLKIDVTTYSV